MRVRNMFSLWSIYYLFLYCLSMLIFLLEIPMFSQKQSSLKKRNCVYKACAQIVWLLYLLCCFLRPKMKAHIRRTRFWGWLSGARLMANPKGNLFYLSCSIVSHLKVIYLSIYGLIWFFLSFYLSIRPSIDLFVNFLLVWPRKFGTIYR